MAIWVEYSESEWPRLRATTRTASGWTEPVTVSSPDTLVQSGYHLSPRLALAADGTADVVWASMRELGQRSAEDVQHSHFDGTSWSTPDNLATDVLGGVQMVELGGDGQGGLAAAWLLWGEPVVVQAAWRSGGAWTVTDVPATPRLSCVMPLAVSAGTGGRATVAWQSATTGALSTVSGVRGSWEQPRTVYTPPEGTGIDAITLREGFDKAPVAAWTTANYDDWSFAALGSRLTASGWQAPTLLSTTGGREYSRPSVAMDPTGRALAAWTAYSGYSGKVQAAWSSAPPAPAPPVDPNTGGRGVLNPPFVRVRGGMLRLPRRGRTVRARLVNRERVVLRGTARLVHFFGRPAKDGSPMRTIALQRKVRVAVKNPSQLRLKLNAEALERLRRSPRHAYPARLYLRLRAPDGRTVRTTQTFTLDGWSRFGQGQRRPLARKAC